MANDSFDHDYIPTVFDNEIAQKTLNMAEQLITLKLTIWDTAGESDFDRLRPLSYPAADIAVVCFERMNKFTLDNVKLKWYPEIQHHRPDVPKVLVATKYDLFPKECRYNHSLLVYGFIHQLRFSELNILDDLIEIILKYEDLSQQTWATIKAEARHTRPGLYDSNVISQYNATDLIGEDDIEEIMSLGFVKFLETSAQSGYGIDDIYHLVRELLANKTLKLRRNQQAKCSCCSCL